MDEPKIVVASDAGISLQSRQDITEAVGRCWGSSGLLLAEGDLAVEFFDLRTGWLGELFQKFTNYRIRLAIVVPDPRTYGERLSELAYEHRAHPMIRFVASEEEARAWLAE